MERGVGEELSEESDVLSVEPMDLEEDTLTPRSYSPLSPVNNSMGDAVIPLGVEEQDDDDYMAPLDNSDYDEEFIAMMDEAGDSVYGQSSNSGDGNNAEMQDVLVEYLRRAILMYVLHLLSLFPRFFVL